MDAETETEMREAISQSGLGLSVVWIGTEGGGELFAIVEDPKTRKRYQWPGLYAWRRPLPAGARPAESAAPRVLANAATKQVKLKQLELF